MDIEVNGYQLPSEITFNFEELKNEITEKVKYYEVLTYTEEQMSEAKKDRAALNKLKKALNDERIRLEREYMKPFEGFKAQVKELCTLIDKPVALIDKQIKNAEEEKKELKKLEIGSYFTVTPHPEWLKLTMIWNDRWLNASCKLQEVKDEMDMTIAMIEGNIKTLEDMECGYEAIDIYRRTLNFNQAITEGQRALELQKRKNDTQRANIPSEEEKPKEEALDESGDASWRIFGGFLTDKQIEAIYTFCANNNITIMEV